MTLVDSDVLIDVRRGLPAAVAWYAGLADRPSVPGFVVMELIQGTRNAVELRRLEVFLLPLPVVWPDEAACGQARANFARFHLSHSLGLIDALIAATVVGRAGTLCTFNVKHYRMVPGLATSQPYARN